MTPEDPLRHGAWIPIAAGLVWLVSAVDHGAAGFLLGTLPGSMILATGIAGLLWPGDPRPRQAGAIAALLGTALGLVAPLWAGVAGGLLLLLLSAASLAALGALSLEAGIPEPGLPPPEHSLRLAAAVALDEALLGCLVPLTFRGRGDRAPGEAARAIELFRERGWAEQPAAYHPAPPPLEDPVLTPRRTLGTVFEHLRFESGYQPHPGEPGADRWRTHEECRTAHAWVLRHRSPERPWLVCVHGLQMGWPLADLTAFRAQWLHGQLGLNLVFPVLPFHGPRGRGLASGSGFLSEQVLDTVHALAQAVWDLRRLLSWLRSRGARSIGVHGLSLGGSITALVASLEDGLACAISSIPAVDLAWLAWRHAPPPVLERFERQGLGHEALQEVMRPVSPLALEPRVPRPRRYLLGGLADQLVPPSQVRALWHHWEEPRIHWTPGSHTSFLVHPGVRRFVEEALRDAGLVS